MSRRRRRGLRGGTGAGGDSLDMLLGPMCNTLGGIVLTAVVLALLTREVDSRADAHAVRQTRHDNAEVLQRRLAHADEDLDRAQTFAANLARRSADPALAARARLTAERARLRAELDSARQAAAEPPGAAPKAAAAPDLRDPGLVAGELKLTLAALVRDAAGEANARAALDEQIARLRRRQADLAAQLQTERDRSERKLRLPKERAKTKEPFFVIVRYGLLYPRFLLQRGEPVINEETIHVTRGDGEMLLEPRPGQGIDPQKDPAGVERLLAGVPAGSCYVAFIVYADSFGGAFDAIKQRVTERGLDYGWDAFENDQPLIFTKKGRSAAPPL